MRVFDTVIIGAGPAGLIASKKIAEKGYNVVLLEKELFPGKKACGEAVSNNTIMDAEIHFNKKVFLNKITGVHVYAPDELNKVQIFGDIEEIGSGYILNKRLFLETMLNESKKQGTLVKLGAEAIYCSRKNGSIKITLKGDHEIFTKIVMGCDGFNSIVRKSFFNPVKIELMSCIQYKMEECCFDDENIIRFYFGKNVAPFGYLWVFPKKNGIANVGVGVRQGIAKHYLDSFINSHSKMFSKAKIMEIGGGPVIISGQIKDIVQNNVLLSGESAGQVMPLTGAGIHTALLSGKIASEVIIESLDENNFESSKLTEYVTRFDIVYGKRIQKSRKALTILEQLNDEDLNKLAEVLSGTDVIDLASGTNVERVAKKLLSHPVLTAKVTKAILK